MIWDRRLVSCIEGYRFRQALDPMMVAAAGQGSNHNPLLEAVGEKLFKGLQQAAQTWACEIDRRDVEFRTREEDDEFGPRVIAEARWHPSTLNILLMDGPLDVNTYALDRDHLWKPLDFAQLPSLPRFDNLATSPVADAVIGMDRVTYWWHGWHEEKRIWTYSIAT